MGRQTNSTCTSCNIVYIKLPHSAITVLVMIKLLFYSCTECMGTYTEQLCCDKYRTTQHTTVTVITLVKSKIRTKCLTKHACTIGCWTGTECWLLYCVYRMYACMSVCVLPSELKEWFGCGRYRKAGPSEVVELSDSAWPTHLVRKRTREGGVWKLFFR